MAENEPHRIRNKYMLITPNSTTSKWFINRFKFIPSFFRMYGTMFSMAHKLKIFYSIINLIIVNMMDMFFSGKLTTKMFLHYKSMLSNLPTFYSMKNVPITSFCSESMFPPKRNVWVSPPSKLSIVARTHSFCINLIKTLFNFTFGWWKNCVASITKLTTILLSFIFSLERLFTKETFSNHGVIVS